MLDIVNSQDEVIGTAERSVAHAEGLKIRLIYVWFYTPDGRIIMQRRSAYKRAHPNRLVSTVSGHVGAGVSYLDAAIRETKEETGVEVVSDELQQVSKVFKETHTPTDISAAFRMSYMYRFTDRVEDLRIEPGEGAGFEAWEPQDLLNALDNQPENFSPFMLHDASKEIIRKIMEMTQ